VHWKRVVLDEAQLIKNHRTKMAQAAWQLNAVHRCAAVPCNKNPADSLLDAPALMMVQ
jgi:SNF2-related domain